MVKKSMYQRIQKLKSLGLSKKRISQELEIDRKTVRKYFGMSEEDFKQYRLDSQYREKYLDKYQGDILDLYLSNNFQRLNMAAVFDYLEEKHGRLSFSEKTLRNYILFLQEANLLSFEESVRVYQKVPELPFGKQMQLDFGQYRCNSGLKVYIFAAVLSSSRFKFITFQEEPFTTLNVIYHLIDCFEYFGGVPQEVVIDQDRLMVVSENQGDIIYTKKFDYFKDEMGFEMFVCRKADPQSKGKVENLVKYVKYNFFNTRDFSNLEEANRSLMEWLQRRANGKISQATKKIPAQDIIEERKELCSIRNSVFRKDFLAGREERTVNEKSYVMINTNNYQVPPAYRKKTVEIYVTKFKLFIFDIKTGKEISKYDLNPLTGQTIVNKDHIRLKESKLDELKQSALELFSNLENWKVFLNQNFKKHSRYVRDQIFEAFRYFKDVENIQADVLEQALLYCLENKTLTFSNLNDTYRHFLLEGNDEKIQNNKVVSIIPKTVNLQIQRRQISDYSVLADGGAQ